MTSEPESSNGRGKTSPKLLSSMHVFFRSKHPTVFYCLKFINNPSLSSTKIALKFDTGAASERAKRRKREQENREDIPTISFVRARIDMLDGMDWLITVQQQHLAASVSGKLRKEGGSGVGTPRLTICYIYI